MRIVWAICRKITKNCNYINKCQSVHQSTYQPFKKWASQLINLTVCLSVNQPFKQLQYHSKVSWQSVASLHSRCNLRFSIPVRIENQESRTSYQEWSRGSSTRGTENKRLTHDCMLGKRPIQVVKRMFHQGHLYQASFPPVKFKRLTRAFLSL